MGSRGAAGAVASKRSALEALEGADAGGSGSWRIRPVDDRRCDPDEPGVVAPVCAKLRALFDDVAEAPMPDPILALAGLLEAKFEAEAEERRRRAPASA